MSTARTSSSNLFTRRHNTDYNNSNSANYTSTSSSPRRPYNKLKGSSGMEDTDGEDEKKVMSLSDRIKKLSTSKILRDNSTLTHNNNEPFTYLKKSSVGGSAAEPPSFGQGYSSLNHNPLSNKPKRELIYAQVVVEDEKNKDYMQNGNGKSKRTIHRSYNNNDYNTTTPSNNYRGLTTTNNNHSSSSNPKMRGRNVTTVLLNSSSDDINELSMNNSFRDKYSSSPQLLLSNDYYPKSPGIVLRAQNYQSNYHQNRKYEDAERQYKGYQPSDDDDYFGVGGGISSTTKYKPTSKYNDEDDDYTFTKKSGYDDEFYNTYQPMRFTPLDNDTNKRQSFTLDNGYNKSTTGKSVHKFEEYNERSYGFNNDEEDQDDDGYNNSFDRFGTTESKRAKTLERDNSFNKTRFGESVTTGTDYAFRSRTLDDRLGSKRGRATIPEEYENEEKDAEEERKFQVLIANKKETKSSKTGGSGNIFSTLLRRTNTKGKGDNQKVVKEIPPQSSKIKSSSSFDKNNTNTSVNKKGGHTSNFFTSFLEKKRKKQSNTNPSPINGSNRINVGLKKEKIQKGNKNNTSSTYESFNPNWPPTVTVTDHSDSPSKSINFYDRDNPIDSNTEQESILGSNDIWKKSYGNIAADNAKIKRRWTMRESSKPSVIREEPEPSSRILDRNKSFLGSSTTPRQGYQSIDRRQTKKYSTADEDQTDGYEYDRKHFSRDSVSPSHPKILGSKYNTIESRYSPEKSLKSHKYQDFGTIGSSGYNQNTLSRGRKAHKGYAYGGGTPNSSGSESNPRNTLVNGSLRSVYLHEAAVIPEMPRTNTASSTGGGGAPSLSGLSGRRTLSKDEISNYSGPRREAKQLSRSMSVVAPWGPNKHYKEKYKEVDYSQSNNNLLLPPRPPSRSPSSRSGSNARNVGSKPGQGTRIQQSKQYGAGSTTKLTKASSKQSVLGTGGLKSSKSKITSSSSVESLLRQDTPPDLGKSKKGNSKLIRSKSIAGPPGHGTSTSKDGRNNRFPTLWFSKKNLK